MNPDDNIAALTNALQGRYRIEREIGEGGMATVYLAHDERHDRKVALKLLKPELAAVVGAERFLAEIKTTANLQHPNILPLFDSGEADGFLYYVMPYVEGETLRDRLEREKQLPVDEAVRIATDVAEALQSAHEQGIIHRDIKPANILLSRGRPLVADFGIALAVSAAGAGRLTETGLSLGTPYYMSPEQAAADRDPSAESDVYSLACVLYEMLVGEPPYTGGSAQAVLVKILTGDAPAPTEVRASIPGNVDAAIRRALERLPADRFRNAAKFARALGDPGFGAGRPDRNSGRAPRGWPRAVVPLLAGIAAVSAALAAWGWFRPIQQEAPQAVRFTIPVPSGHLMWIGQGSRLAVSPDGSAVAWVANDGFLYVRKLAEFEARLLEGTESAESPFFSPDGRWIGFARDGGFSKVAVEGGPVIKIPGATGTAFDVGAHWHPSGVILYSPLAGSDGIWSLPEEGGTPRKVLARESPELHLLSPQLLDDGRLLLYTADAPSASFRDLRSFLRDLETGERFVVAEGGTHARWVATGHVVYVDASGTATARPVDLRARRPTGPPFPVQAGVRVSFWGGGAASFQLSAGGTAAHVLGSTTALHRIGWLDRRGRVTGYVVDGQTVGDLRLSPDGAQVVTWVATFGNADLWVIDLSAGERTQLTDTPAWEWRGVWSHDGTKIAHQGSLPGSQGIFVRDAAPGRPSELVLESATELWPSSWSPDGRWVAFGESSGAGQRNVFAADLENPGQRVAIAQTEADEWDARFAPGGSMVAYVSDNEVVVGTFPDGNWRRPISNGGGMSPRWSPGGDELLYWQGTALVSRAWRPDSPREFGPARVLFQSAEEPLDVQYHWDVSPDGQRFLVKLDDPDAPAREIHVDTDWFGLLREAGSRQ